MEDWKKIHAYQPILLLNLFITVFISGIAALFLVNATFTTQ